MPCDSGTGAADLWAMAAELERQYAGYKQRLAERTTTAGATSTARDHDVVDDYGDADADADADVGGDGAEEEEEDDEAGGVGDDVMRGRMYEAYVRRRDERLRDGWRARMERKEAEVKALWAQLELAAGRATGGGVERAAPAGGDPTTTTTAATATDGDDDEERQTERTHDDRRRSTSDTALAPRRITGKKHARTRSFSSSMTTIRNRDDVGRRRALSQEPPPSEPDASSGESTKERPGGAAATTTATTRPRTSLRRRNSSVKGHGFAKQAAAGPKLPRTLPRRPSTSSGQREDLGRGVAPPVVQANADVGAPPVPSHSTEYTAPSGTPSDSPPRISFSGRDDDGSGGTGTANVRATSPEPDRGAVEDTVPDGEPEAKDDSGVEQHGEEKLDANGEITSDSEPEPSYVYINKDAAEEQQAMEALSEPPKLPGANAALDPDVKASEETPAAPEPAEATAAVAEIATTNAEEAPARESSDESSLSVRSSGPSARPSCSSRDQSIERLLEADAALVRKKREERAEKSAAPAPRTPQGSAGSRFSGASRSPRESTVRGFKRFLSFGKKHRGKEATVIDCTSPSVPSPADDDSGSGRWQPAGGSIKPRMGSSDAASDDTDHGYPLSPQAACSLQSLVAASPAKSELAEIVPQEKSPKVHRSFFSFRSLNCGRG